MYRFLIFIGTLMLLALPTNYALAVQAHGGEEGLVSHQIGHTLFVLGMGYLLFRLYYLRMKGAGWSEFKVFLWLIIAWNVLTFSGHWMDGLVKPDKFITSAGHPIVFSITNFMDAYYYLTRLDHLLLVPAFGFFTLALRKWRSQA